MVRFFRFELTVGMAQTDGQTDDL